MVVLHALGSIGAAGALALAAGSVGAVGNCPESKASCCVIQSQGTGAATLSTFITDDDKDKKTNKVVVDLKGDYANPLATWTSDDDEDDEEIRMVLKQSDGSRAYTIRINNDDIEAEVNGKKIDSDRIHWNDGQVKILDKKGNLVAEFQVHKGGHGGGHGDVEKIIIEHDGAHGAHGDEHGNVTWEPGQQGQWFSRNGNQFVGEIGDGGGISFFSQPGAESGAQQGEQPKVMIGITMADPDGALMEHFGLEGGVMLDQVIEGLAGHRSGLRSKDIIVLIDGKSPVSQEVIRKVLRSKNPGDDVKLKVLRKGQGKEVIIKLDKFDGTRLGRIQAGASGGGANALSRAPGVPGVTGAPGRVRVMPRSFTFEGNNQEEIMKHLEEAMRQFEGKNGQVQEEARRAIEEAMKAMKGHSGGMGGGMGGKAGEFRFGFVNPNDDDVVVFGDGEDVFTLPGGGGGAWRSAPDVGDRLDQLADRLDAIDRRFDRMERLLERIAEGRGR